MSQSSSSYSSSSSSSSFSSPFSPDLAELRLRHSRADRQELIKHMTRENYQGEKKREYEEKLKQLDEDISSTTSRLHLHRSESRYIAWSALCILFLIAVVLFIFEINPLEWMEKLNKERLHEERIRYRG